MSDRHPKWQRVEPGTVIPAGQPHRREMPDNGRRYILAAETRKNWEAVTVPDDSREWFVDSSWRPPLVLPTEPTWGIAVRRDKNGETFAIGDEWCESDESFTSGLCNWSADSIVAFIPLTEEQVHRIEAAR